MEDRLREIGEAPRPGDRKVVRQRHIPPAVVRGIEPAVEASVEPLGVGQPPRPAPPGPEGPELDAGVDAGLLAIGRQEIRRVRGERGALQGHRGRGAEARQGEIRRAVRRERKRSGAVGEDAPGRPLERPRCRPDVRADRRVGVLRRARYRVEAHVLPDRGRAHETRGCHAATSIASGMSAANCSAARCQLNVARTCSGPSSPSASRRFSSSSSSATAEPKAGSWTEAQA